MKGQSINQSIKGRTRMSSQWKIMTSKFPGKCKSCNKAIAKGETIAWSSGLGAFHEGCDIKINGRPVEELEAEWDKENQGNMTMLDRFEEMRTLKEYANITEDDLMIMAQQDTPRNPYRGMSRNSTWKRTFNCHEHGDVEPTKWEGEEVCPYHQRTKMTEEGPVLMYEEFDQDGN